MLLRTITEEGRLYMIEDKRKGFNGKSTAWIESWKMSRSKIGRDAKVRWWHCPGRCKYAQWLVANGMIQNAFGCVRYEWMSTHTRWVCSECLLNKYTHVFYYAIMPKFSLFTHKQWSFKRVFQYTVWSCEIVLLRYLRLSWFYVSLQYYFILFLLLFVGNMWVGFNF